MRHLHLLAFALLLALACDSCKPTPGTPQTITPGTVVSCGTQAVTAHATEALPGVNACLSGKDDITTCLLGLVQPAVGITLDVIACLTKHEGSAASAASQANPDDKVDARRAARAREFLEKNDIHFSDSPGGG
jgi:hypothetical protein